MSKASLYFPTKVVRVTRPSLPDQTTHPAFAPLLYSHALPLCLCLLSSVRLFLGSDVAHMLALCPQLLALDYEGQVSETSNVFMR